MITSIIFTFLVLLHPLSFILSAQYYVSPIIMVITIILTIHILMNIIHFSFSSFIYSGFSSSLFSQTGLLSLLLLLLLLLSSSSSPSSNINNHYQQLLSTTNINIIYINDKHYRFHSILLMTSGGSWRPSRKARAAAWNATSWSRRRRCSKRRQRGARNVWMVYFMEILLKWMITRGIALW